MTDSRVWVITGASSGLGLAMSLYMLEKGDRVISTVRSLAKFPAALKEAGARPLILDLDSSDEVIQKAAEEAIQIYGHVDVVVNNAGNNTSGYGPVEEVSMSRIRQQFQGNLFGTIAFTQPFITHFRTRRSGHIINVSSMGATSLFASWGAYGASKAALEAFSDALAQELSLFNVRVTIVVPGYFPTNIFAAIASPASAGGDQQHKADPATVYTDPFTQGFGSKDWWPRWSEASGYGGAAEKLAARVYEVATGVGFAQEVIDKSKAGANWIRVPCGSDSGRNLLNALEQRVQNIKAFEPIWTSTDITSEKRLDVNPADFF